MKKFLIYKTINNINKKIYVGCHITNNINDGYLGSGLILIKAILKYGKENFSREILAECSSKEEMFALEKEIVNKDFIKREDTYNIAIGGHGGFGFINAHNLNNSANQFLVASDKMKLDKEFKKKFCENTSKGLLKYAENHPENPNRWVGRKHKPETKEKMKEAFKNGRHQQGSKNSQFGSMWITNGKENKKISKQDSIPEGYRKGRVCKQCS